MIFPYRTQRLIKRIFSAILVIALLIAAGCVCWFIWAQRYLVYTADGRVQLNFDLPPIAAGQVATEPEKIQVNVIYEAPVVEEEEEEEIPVTTELAQMVGYYVELTDLKDIPKLKEQITALPAGTPVMLPVRSAKSGFYYSSQVRTSRSADVNTQEMDELIAWLKDQDVYTIAKLPALRFAVELMYEFSGGTDHIPDSVFYPSGIGSYLDQQPECNYYWLHPGSNGTIKYLKEVIVELRDLGFDEVFLDDFCFPQGTEDILVNGDRAEILTKSAQTLLTACSTDLFAVSFASIEEFTAPTGRSRLYMPAQDISQAQATVLASSVTDPVIQLVFLTDSYDTRFESYSVLRPISGAH